MRSLDWFPLMTGMGTMDATGGRKLLGTSKMSFADLFVRESAQNSWDARLSSAAGPLHYGLRIRTLDVAATRLLSSRVLTGDLSGLRLIPRYLELPVLEVWDRGTTGLNGPVRNDITVPSGASRNFIDLVLNLGAPRDNDMGGGTYGFGKTASYIASGTGTIVIWSRTHHEGRLEDRFIASAMAEGFPRDGRSYTGRHWWGRRVDDRVEPIRGTEAAELGQALFERHFDGDETGTSILVIDPSEEHGLTGEGVAEDLAYAITLNLWPKLLDSQPESRTMQIDLVDHGEAISLQPLDPLWSAYGDCLRAIRAVQGGEDTPSNPMVKVVPIESQRPRALIGHLALLKRPRDPNRGEPEHHVCLMRNEAELVVKYQGFPALDDGVLEWVGVFKPTAENDDAFAQAEPPAHDDWIVPKGKSRSQTLVRTALRKIKDEVDRFLRPVQVRDPQASAHPTAALADTLADIAGGEVGGRVVPLGASRSAGSGKSRVSNGRAKVADIRTEHHRSGRTLFVDVDVTPGPPVLIRPKVGVAVEGGVDSKDVPVYVRGWVVDGVPGGEEQVRTDGRSQLQLILDVSSDVAVDLRLDVERGVA